MIEQSPKELTVANFVPVWNYNLQTLENFKVLDFSTAVRVSGQELTTFDDNEKYQALVRKMMGDDPKSEKYHSGGLALAEIINAYNEQPYNYNLSSYVVDSDLASRLAQAGVQVPEDKRTVFGDDFSKIVEYNGSLQRPILTEEDGASPEFREALYEWHRYLDPILGQGELKERFILLHHDRELDPVWDLPGYIRESLATGRSREEVGGVISERLGKLLGFDYFDITLPRYEVFNQEMQIELRKLKAVITNSALVFENYKRANQLRDQFRNQFRDQIRALVDLYSNSERWNIKTQRAARRIEEFLGGHTEEDWSYEDWSYEGS